MDDGRGAGSPDRARDEAVAQGGARRGLVGVLAVGVALAVVAAFAVATRTTSDVAEVTSGSGSSDEHSASLVVGLTDGRVLRLAEPLPASVDGSGTTTAPSTSFVSEQLVQLPQEVALLDLGVDATSGAVVLSTTPTGSCSPTMALLDPATGSTSELGAGENVDGHNGALAYTTGGDCAASVDESGTVPADARPYTLHLGPGEDPVTLHELTPRPAPPLGQVAFSDDGGHVAVIDGEVVLVDLQAGAATRTVAGTGDATAVAFVGQDDLLVARDGYIQLHQTDAPERAVGRLFDTAGRVASIGTWPGEDDPTASRVLWVTTTGELWITTMAGDAKQLLLTDVVDAAFAPPIEPDTGQPTTTSATPTMETTPATPVVAGFDGRAAMGGTSNHLGWHRAIDDPPADSYNLSVFGGCTGAENGERYLARYFARRGSCTGTPNPDHRPTGYTFLIDVPVAHPAIDVQLLEPYSAPVDGSIGDPTRSGGVELVWECADCEPTTTTFELVGPDGVQLASKEFGPSERRRTAAPIIETLASIPADAPEGHYVLRVTANAMGSSTNSFGIAAVPDGLPTLCDPDRQPACPRLYALDGLPMQVLAAEVDTRLPLTYVSAGDLSRHVDIELFDAGEGAASLFVLDGAGNAVPFTWSDDGSVPVGAAITELWVAPMDLNGKVLRLRIAPGTSAAAGWWTVRYRTQEASTDRTTWDVYLRVP